MMKNLKLFSREQVGIASEKGRQYSRPDSLSLVSRQSVLAFLLVLLTTVFSVGNAWGAVVSGTKYETKTASGYPTGWTQGGEEYSTSGGGFKKITESSYYIQTDEFCQNGITSIKVKVRKFGTVTGGKEVLTVEWIENGSATPVELGTISPTTTSLADYTISNPTGVSGNKSGSIKIYSKKASSGGGAGVSEVTITYTSGTCGSSCANTVTITKGAETNGTYTLSATSVCGDGDGEDVTISDITPADGYAFDEITTSASGTVDNENKKVTGITAATTITVKFKELQKYTVSFSTGVGNPTQADIAEATAGAGITLPAGPTPACEGWTFAGWAAAAVASETTTAPTLLSGTYHPSGNITLYAVYKRTESGGGESGTVTITRDSENFPTAYGDANTFTEYTLEGYKFKIQQVYATGSGDNKKMQWRASGNSSGTGTIYNTQTYPAKISSIVLTYHSSDGNKNHTLKVGNTENPTGGTEITGTTLNGVETFDCSSANADYFVLANGANAGYTISFAINYGAASTTYYLSAPSCTPDFYIAGDFTSWGTNKIPVIGESKTVTLTAGDHQLKVIDGEVWKGFSNLTASEMIAGLSSDNDGNICFTLAEAGDVTVTYISEGVFKLAGDFTPQTVSVKGGWDSWAAHEMALSEDKKSASVKLTLAAANEVEFGIMVNSDFRANNYKYHRDFTGATGITGNSGNMKLTSDIDGDYTFTWTFGTNGLNITFPPMKYAVNFSAEHGSIAVKKGEETVSSGNKFVAGTELTVTATPDTENHYIGGTIKVVKTASPEVDVTSDVLDGSTLTVPDYDITISATFTPTYAITTVADGGSIALEYTKGDAAEGYAVAGTAITATATADGSHTFASLAVSENVTSPTIEANVASFTMPAGAVTVTATFDVKSTPTITVSESSIAFDAVDYKGVLAAETFNVSGVALAAGQLTIACNNEAFTVSPATIDVDGILAETEVTVTPKTTACGTFNGKITISGGNAEAKEVSLSLTVNKLAHGVAWGESAKSGIIGESYSHPTLSNPHKLMVALSSEDEDIAYFDEGNIVLNAPGTVKIYANVAGTNDTVALPAENAVYYTLTVQKKYTAKWYLNGEVSSSQTALPGTDLEVPSDPTELAEDCADMVFKGWASAPIVGKQDDAPDFVNFDGAKMPSEDVNYYAVFAVENEGVTKVDYQYTIATTDFNTTSYAANNNEKTVNAVCTTDESKKLEVKFTSYQVMLSGSLIQGQKKAGAIYNAAAWGSKIKSITINDNVNYTYVIGSEAEPTVTAEGAFFKISAGSETSKASSIDIVFEVSNNTTTYSDYMTTCPVCTKVTLSKAAATNGSFVLKQNGVEVSAPVKTCEATTVDVVATPATGYALTNVALSGVAGATYAEGVISIPAEASGELTVTATFSAINYTVTLTQEGGAAVELEDQENKHYGDVIELEAPDKDGFIFVKWSATPEVEFVNANAASTTFPMPNSDVTVKATYAKLYNVAGASALADGTTHVAISGFVSEIKSIDPSKYTRAQYYISDNGKTDEQFLVYNGYYLNGADITSLEQIVVGDKVLVYGNIGSYNEVTQVAQNNYLLSSTHLSSIAIDASAAATAYEKGEEFELNKVKATATFADASTVDVTAWATWTPASAPEINAAGDVELSATWCDKSDDETVTVTLNTHAVTFEAPEHGTLVVKNGGAAITSGNEFAKGTVLTVEAAANAGYKLTALTAGGVDILESKEFTVGTAAVAVEATVVAKTAAGLSWPNATATAYTVGKSYTLQTLNNPNSLTVAYASSNTDVATINAESGAITVKAAGSTVITATSAETDVYAAGEASYTLNVYALTSVVVSGEATKTVYDKGEAFDHTGLVATANYGDETTLDVTDLATWTPDPATITAEGTVNVTAAWSGKTSEALEVPVTLKKYQLNYILPAQGTLSIKQNETLVNSGTKWVEGTQFTVSSTAPSADYKAGVYTVTDWGEPATDVTTAVLSGNTLTMPKYNVIVTVAFAEKPAAPINWSAATGKAYLPDVIDNVLPVLNNENSLTVSYSSSEELVAEIAANGALTIKKPGETTIKATYTATADGAYKTTEVSYTLHVYDLASVVVTGDASKKAYEAGETFSFAGLGAKATFEDAAEYTIPANDIVWTNSLTDNKVNAAGDVTVTAEWQGLSGNKVVGVTLLSHELTFNTPTNGTLVVEYNDAAVATGDHFLKGDVLTITATPASIDYKLASLTVNGEAFTSGSTYTVGTEDIDIVASFTKKPEPTLSWSIDPNNPKNVYLSGRDEDNEFPTAINPLGLPLTYGSLNGSVAEIDAEGNFILHEAGFASMYFNFAGNETYCSVHREYPLTVYALDRIEIGGEATATEYEAGDAFDRSGLTATAVYKVGAFTENYDVTTKATWNAAPATIAAATESVSVTAAWNGKTSAVKSIPVTVNTYAVTFEAPANGTLVVKNGGAAITSGNEFAKGTVLTVEAAANAGYKLTALTAGGVDILESKQFTVGTAAVAVVATVEAKTAAGLSWPNATATAYTVGKSYTLQTLNNPNSLTVAYASSNTDVATINAESGAITVKVAGSTVITATSAETDVYAAGVASYTLDVYGPAALAISGEATKTSYEKGDAFDRTGLVASVLYGDASVLVVTDLATWTADPATVTANGNVTVTAKWEGLSDDEEVAVTVKTHKVIFDAPTNGSLEILNGEDAVASGAEFVAGTELTITATADQGYKLSSLTVNGEDFVSGETYTMGAQAVVVVATFVQDSGTTIDNAEAGEKAQKIMLNNQLFILRGGKMYDAQGKLVK